MLKPTATVGEKRGRFIANDAIITRQHWIQCITFAAKTNVALRHAVAAGHTHTHRCRASQYLLRSLSGSKGNNNKLLQLHLVYYRS